MQKKHADAHVSHEMQFEEHKSEACELALGQCADALKNKLEATNDYKALVEDAHDVIESLKHVKNIVHKFEGDKCLQGSLHHACKAFYEMK